MRNLKRVLSLALASTMLLGMMVMGAGAAEEKKVATAADLSDMGTVVNKEAVSLLVDLEIIAGKTDGTYAPTETVNRATMARLVTALMMGADVDQNTFKGTVTDLTDVDGHWAEGYIKYCYSTGIILGDGQGHFFPDQPVTTAAAAKMLLVAIGYDNGEFGGTNWSSKAMSLAAGTRTFAVSGLGTSRPLTKGLSIKANDPLTRDSAAQMIFNSLFVATQTPSYQWDAGVQHIDGYKAGPSLGETNYGNPVRVTGTLTKATAGSVEIDTPTTEGGKLLTTSLADITASAADLGKLVAFYVSGDTVNASLISSAVVASGSNVLGTSTDGTDIPTLGNKVSSNKKYIAQIETDATYFVNGGIKTIGANGTPSGANYDYANVAALSAANVKVGSIVELLNTDADAKAEIVKVTTKTVRVLSGDAATKVVGDTTQVKVPGVLSSFVSAYTTKNVFGYEDLKKDDVVLYYKDADDSYHFEKAESLEGQLTSKKGTTLTISGSGYKVSTLTGAMPFADVEGEGYNEDVTYWLDNGGNIVRAKAGAVDKTTTSALMMGFQKLGTGWSESFEAMLVFADGTSEIVTVSNGADLKATVAIFDAVAAAAVSGRYDDVYAVEYYVNTDGDYELTLKGNIGTTAAETGVISKGNATIPGGYTANATTTFMAAQYKDGDPTKAITGYKTYTGIANIPTFGTIGNEASYMVYVKGSLANIVLITAGAPQGSDKAFAYVTNVTDVGYTPKSGDTNAYYTFDAVVDGENVSLKAKAANTFTAIGLYEVTYTDEIVTNVTSKVADQTETAIDNLGGGVVKVDSTNYTLAEDAMAYIVDGKDGSSVSVADIENDANDLVFIDKKDSSTIKNLYIVKVADAEMPSALKLNTVDLLTADKVINMVTGTGTLTVTSTAADDTTVSYTIDGAGTDTTDGAYTVVAADKGADITVTVTIVNDAAPLGTLTLTYTVKVAKA